jgi:hypothetical protein
MVLPLGGGKSAPRHCPPSLQLYWSPLSSSMYGRLTRVGGGGGGEGGEAGRRRGATLSRTVRRRTRARRARFFLPSRARPCAEGATGPPPRLRVVVGGSSDLNEKLKKCATLRVE